MSFFINDRIQYTPGNFPANTYYGKVVRIYPAEPRYMVKVTDRVAWAADEDPEDAVVFARAYTHELSKAGIPQNA